MKKRIHANSMTSRVLLAVLLGIFLVVVSVSGIIINLSKEVFVNTYGKSQEKVFMQIEQDLNEHHEHLSKMIDAVDSSWAFRMYFSNKPVDSKVEFQMSYKMDRDLEHAMSAGISDVSVMLIGVNGKRYINREESGILGTEEILNSEITKTALANKNKIVYQYADTGFTVTSRGKPVLMATKALCYDNSEDPYAYIYITMKESDVRKFYNYFISEYSQFYMAQQDGKIVTSDTKADLGKNIADVLELEKTEKDQIRTEGRKNGKNVTVLKKELPYYDYTIYGVIDSERALGNLYNVYELWVICSLIAAVVALITFVSVRQTTKPLSGLVKKMATAKEKKYDEYIEVTGPYEVRELTSTYNAMLKDINHYIDERMAIQKEKRKAEISALQMQINPHYVYNTLASIKWLIYEGEIEKSTRAIDAFISLLRSTIGNTDEYIALDKEIENLKNYVLINNTRYGNKVQVDYFVNFGCEEYLIPKMILQPFVENAFFHAFPGERKGNITILVRKLEDRLQIQIADDGVGMNHARLTEISAGHTKSEHFTGIGVNNVDDRLKLIYGSDYGIEIDSKENRGTTITVTIPIQTEEAPS